MLLAVSYLVDGSAVVLHTFLSTAHSLLQALQYILPFSASNCFGGTVLLVLSTIWWLFLTVQDERPLQFQP